MRSNPWTLSAPNSSRLFYTSSAIQSSSAPSPPSPISSTRSDIELVLLDDQFGELLKVQRHFEAERLAGLQIDAQVVVRHLSWGLAYRPRSGSSDPLSGAPARAVRDAAANSCTLARIGPNGPNLCCSRLKPSAYGPFGVSIGFWSRTGKYLSRFAFSGRFWLLM